MSLRWARSRARALIRSALLHLLATLDRRPARGVVNLFFHAIPEEQAERFESFLDVLLGMGRVVSMEDALRQGDDPEPVFTISFDDGFRTTYAVAGSILSRRGIPSTIFIATEFVGLSGAALESFTHDRLNWPHVQPAITGDEVRACASRGMQIGSHGVTHKSFSGMDDAEAESELRESRAKLERLSGQPVRYFAWPFGSLSAFPSGFLELAKQTGYEAVYSGVSRTAPNLPAGIQPRRELNLAWGARICAYLARRG